MPLWSSPQCGKGSPKCLIFNLEIQRENNDHFWFTVTKNLCFVPVSRSPCSEYHSSTDVQLRHSLIFFNDLVCECDIMLKCVSLTFESENACMTSHREVWESYNDSRSSTDNSTQSSHLVAKTRPAKDVKKSWDFLACENDKTAMTSPPPSPSSFLFHGVFCLLFCDYFFIVGSFFIFAANYFWQLKICPVACENQCSPVILPLCGMEF